MHTVTDGDVALAYSDAGAGDPVLFVHGAFIADAFRPLFSEPALAEHRLIAYHRRGYGESKPAPASMTLAEHASDCRARFLGFQRARVATGGATGATTDEIGAVVRSNRTTTNPARKDLRR